MKTVIARLVVLASVLAAVAAVHYQSTGFGRMSFGLSKTQKISQSHLNEIQRGGYQNEFESPNDIYSAHYLTLGLIHLGSLLEGTPNTSKEITPTNISNLIWSFITTRIFHLDYGEAAPIWSHSPASIIAIPIHGGTSTDENTISYPSKQKTKNVSLTHFLETIGCLADIIVIILPSIQDNNDMHHRGEDSQQLIQRVIQGIQRQKMGRSRNLSLVLVSCNSTITTTKLETVGNHNHHDHHSSTDTTENQSNTKVDIYTIQIPSHVNNTSIPDTLENVLLPYYSVSPSTHQHHDHIPLSLFHTLVENVYDKLSLNSFNNSDTVTVNATVLTLSSPCPLTIPQIQDHMMTNDPSVQVSSSANLTQSTGRTDRHDQFNGNWEVLFHDIISSQIQHEMDDLELKQENVLLDMDRQMPILEFGKEANEIILHAGDLFDQYCSRSLFKDTMVDDSMIQEKRNEFLLKVAGDRGIRRLFRQQLDSLREYYGRRYDILIRDMDVTNEAASTSISGKEDQRFMDIASSITESFRVAAQNAVPQACKEGTPLHGVDGGYGYVDVLAGLIRDMTEIGISIQRMHETWDAANGVDSHDDQDPEESSEKGPWYSYVSNIFKKKKRLRPAKWYEKLASRAITLAINYLQGWLAWQGIKKAAEERDKNVPKFPLF